MNQITIREPNPYYCYQDKKAFFQWLETIEGIKKGFVGGPSGLTLHLQEEGLKRDDWADLIGLVMRYDVDIPDSYAVCRKWHSAAASVNQQADRA